MDGQERSQAVNDLVGGDGVDGVDFEQGEIGRGFELLQLALLDALDPMGRRRRGGVAFHGAPPGRYRATRAEVYQRFVNGRGEHRQRVWRDWESATSLLGRHVHVNACWLYGRFLSDEPEPEVVACVYWAEDLELSKAHLV